MILIWTGSIKVGPLLHFCRSFCSNTTHPLRQGAGREGRRLGDVRDRFPMVLVNSLFMRHSKSWHRADLHPEDGEIDRGRTTHLPTWDRFIAGPANGVEDEYAQWPCAGQLKPGLGVFGYGLAQQRATGLPTCVWCIALIRRVFQTYNCTIIFFIQLEFLLLFYLKTI